MLFRHLILVSYILKIIFIMKMTMSTSSPILYTELIIIHAEMGQKFGFMCEKICYPCDKMDEGSKHIHFDKVFTFTC